MSSTNSCDAETLDSYDLSAHVIALFAIFAVSVCGVNLPLITYYSNSAEIHPIIITFCIFFGTGVVIATSFIHMILPAINNLTNECLGVIVEEYEPLALLIVMVTIFVMQFTEFTASRTLSGNVSTVEPDALRGQDIHHHNHIQAGNINAERSLIILFLFELGVALHSIIIGITLGVVRGNEFTTLLIALCFHQFFEGFALGSALFQVDPKKQTTLITTMAFALSTPLGVAIGISINSTFNENSKISLWMIGIFEAISAGALAYTGLIELLTYGLTLNPKFSCQDSCKKSIAAAFTGLYCGAAAMSVIGKWA